MESFPPAPPTAPRLPFIRLSRQDTSASWRCPQTILLNHHFPPGPPTRSTPSRHPSAHCACGNFFVLFSVASASFRFIIKIWLAANSGSFWIYAALSGGQLQLPVKRQFIIFLASVPRKLYGQPWMGMGRVGWANFWTIPRFNYAERLVLRATWVDLQFH